MNREHAAHGRFPVRRASSTSECWEYHRDHPDAAISLRLPADLHAALVERARTEQRTVEEVILSILRETLPADGGSVSASREVSEHAPTSVPGGLPKPDRGAPQ